MRCHIIMTSIWSAMVADLQVSDGVTGLLYGYLWLVRAVLKAKDILTPQKPGPIFWL